MDNLDIQQTKYTMHVHFDAVTGEFNMVGNSYPEDANSFFDPIYQWLDQFIKNVKGEIQLHIRLNYVNSSSSKCFIDLFEILERYHLDGGKILVRWYYEEGDDEILDAGEELLEDMEFPYELIES